MYEVFPKALIRVFLVHNQTVLNYTLVNSDGNANLKQICALVMARVRFSQKMQHFPCYTTIVTFNTHSSLKLDQNEVKT